MGWFFLAVIGAYILGNAEILSQWIGWSVCSLSCLIWILWVLKIEIYLER